MPESGALESEGFGFQHSGEKTLTCNSKHLELFFLNLNDFNHKMHCFKHSINITFYDCIW